MDNNPKLPGKETKESDCSFKFSTSPQDNPQACPKETSSDVVKESPSHHKFSNKEHKEVDEESTSYGHSIEDGKNNVQSQKSMSPGSFTEKGLNFTKQMSTPVKRNTNPRHSLNYN